MGDADSYQSANRNVRSFGAFHIAIMHTPRGSSCCPRPSNQRYHNQGQNLMPDIKAKTRTKTDQANRYSPFLPPTAEKLAGSAGFDSFTPDRFRGCYLRRWGQWATTRKPRRTSIRRTIERRVRHWQCLNDLRQEATSGELPSPEKWYLTPR